MILGANLAVSLFIRYLITSLLRYLVPPNSLGINTCKSVSKQKTSTPFGINTYKKYGGWGSLTKKPFSEFLSDSRLLPRLHLSPLISLVSALFSLLCTPERAATLFLAFACALFAEPYGVALGFLTEGFRFRPRQSPLVRSLFRVSSFEPQLSTVNPSAPALLFARSPGLR